MVADSRRQVSLSRRRSGDQTGSEAQMERGPLRKGLLISAFKAENLSAYLKNDASDPRVDKSTIPYGQVGQAVGSRALETR